MPLREFAMSNASNYRVAHSAILLDVASLLYDTVYRGKCSAQDETPKSRPLFEEAPAWNGSGLADLPLRLRLYTHTYTIP